MKSLHSLEIGFLFVDLVRMRLFGSHSKSLYLDGAPHAVQKPSIYNGSVREGLLKGSFWQPDPLSCPARSNMSSAVLPRGVFALVPSASV